MTPRSVLVIDDDPDLLSTLTALLERNGHRVTAAPDGTAAAQAIEDGKFDLIITDVLFPGQHRVEALMDLIQRKQKARVIAMSGGGRYLPEYYLRLLKSFGARAVLAKPFTEQQLLAAIGQVFPEKTG